MVHTTARFWSVLSCLLIIALHATHVHAQTNRLSLVTDGKAVAVLVVPDDQPRASQELATYFAHIVERSTSGKLPVVTETQADSLPATTARVYLGETKFAAAAGLDPQKLAAETYTIVAKPNALIILGRDSVVPVKLDENNQWTRWRRDVDSWPSRWAVNHLLEKELGVRWLWPGELGTYVPKHNSFAVDHVDATYQPDIYTRTYGVGSSGVLVPGEGKQAQEAYEWVVNHEGSTYDAKTIGRPDLEFNHAFNKWFDRYGKDHPDWFITLPPGTAPRKSYRMKLRFANPEVIEKIASEYQKAGAPEYWCVSENDGSGFDTSDEIRAWDIPLNQDITDIWNGKANLSARYVKIWNTLYDRLKQINPDVTLIAMAYSAYRDPPTEARPLTAKMVMVIVCGYDGEAYTQWDGWRGASNGNSMILRPNWGWVGGGAPYLPLDQIHKFMTHAHKNGMVGYRLDSILGYWANQGPMYYLIARTLNRPELTEENILDEYTSAFGKGSPVIREYLNHWQQYSDQVSFDMSGTSNPDGLFSQLRKKQNISSSGFIGPRQSLATLYSDDVLKKGYDLLDTAVKAIGSDDADSLARVDFLRTGLDELRKTRDLVTLFEKLKDTPKPTLELANAYRKAYAERAASQEKATASHAVWGHRQSLSEKRYNYPSPPEKLKLPAGEDDGW